MKKYILPLVAALLMTGCEDYLDIKPYDRTIPKSTEDFSALVHDLCYKIDIGDLNYVVGSFQESMNFEEISDNMEALSLTARREDTEASTRRFATATLS